MFRRLLASEFEGLSDEQLAQLEAHYKLLIQWNQKINLTRIQKLDEIVRFHYCESLFLARALPSGPLRILDVGSGAGFPGIPIAILRPECFVHLVESHQRKAVFLREASRDLPNVSVLAQRADAVSGAYDWIVSRAVDPDEVLRLTMAPNQALLIGGGDATRLKAITRAVPWGQNRVLATFHVERDT
jgi:16S rRNA (guanine527-N7)-methyltransferase